MKEYYDTRAPEYDDWYLGLGRFADRDRPGWEEELAELIGVIERLPAKQTLDVACGTGVIARLAAEAVGSDGTVTGLDVTPDMIEVAIRSLEQVLPPAERARVATLPSPLVAGPGAVVEHQAEDRLAAPADLPRGG